jgi:hypothetical protein
MCLVPLDQLRGFASPDIREAFRSVHLMAEAIPQCKQPFFHVQVRNPEGERLTREQWRAVADRIENRIGYKDQPRAIVFHHSDTGACHMHIAWSRIDSRALKAKPLPFYKLRLKAVARELEKELGLTPVRNHRDTPVMAPNRKETEQARRLGVDLRRTRLTIRDCWDRSDTGEKFRAALAAEGLTLARGTRRDFLVIDGKGGMHALGKRIFGNTAGEIRERLADIPRDQLPTVEQTRVAIRSEGGRKKETRKPRQQHRGGVQKMRQVFRVMASPASKPPPTPIKRITTGSSAAGAWTSPMMPAPATSGQAIVKRVWRNAPPLSREPQRPAHRSGPSSLGELYAYYKRMGMLEVFFAMFPRP